MDKIDVKFRVENVEWQDKHTIYLSVYFHSEEVGNSLAFFLSDWIAAGLVCVIDSSLFWSIVSPTLLLKWSQCDK